MMSQFFQTNIKNRIIILLIYIYLFLIVENNDNILLEIDSRYPHSLVLSNGNLVIVHEYGINLYDPLLTNMIRQYNFTEENTITSQRECASISIFQEEETENKYIFILAKNILYIFSPELEYKLSSDMTSYLISNLNYHECSINYVFLFYQFKEPNYYFFIGYPKEGYFYINYFSANISSESVSNIDSLTYISMNPDGSYQTMSKFGITCQIMNSNVYGSILTCFYKINYPMHLKVACFKINETNNIEHLSVINTTSAQVDLAQSYIKSSLSNDRKKALICYTSEDYERPYAYCVSFNIDSLYFGEEKKYAEKCGESIEFINTYHFKEKDEYFFVCKTKGSNEEYKIIKFDNDLNKIDIDNDEYGKEPNFNVTECSYMNTFSLIYLSQINSYVIIGDPIIDGTIGVIRFHSLPYYYNASYSSSNSSLFPLVSSTLYHSKTSYILSSVPFITSSNTLINSNPYYSLPLNLHSSIILKSTSYISKTNAFIHSSNFSSYLSSLSLISSYNNINNNNNNNIKDCEIVSKNDENYCFQNFTNFIIDHIKELNKNNNKINKISDTIYLYNLETKYEDIKINNSNLFFIDGSGLKQYLIEQYNLQENNKIYILSLEIFDENEQSAISDYEFKIILENGTELDLSKIGGDLYSNISIPIKNLDKANYDYAIYFAEFGYDIYDVNNSFYKNICSSAYIEDNDLVINDRKKYIYPNNVSLCIKNCIYRGTDLNNKRVICECNLNNNDNLLNYSNNYNNEITDNSDNNFFNYLSDMINYKLFKCYILLLSFDNYKKNIIFYLLIITVFLYIFFILKIFIKRIPYMRELMIKNISKPKSIKKYRTVRIRKKVIKLSAKSNGFISKEKEKIMIGNTNDNLLLKNSNIYHPIIIKKLKKRKVKPGSSKINVLDKNNNKKIIENKNKDNKDIDYNNLTYSQAIILDKRDLVKIFNLTIIEKINIINLITNKKTNIKELLISQYILSLLLDFF